MKVYTRRPKCRSTGDTDIILSRYLREDELKITARTMRLAAIASRRHLVKVTNKINVQVKRKNRHAR